MTKEDAANFKLYAQYAGASYCKIGKTGAPTYCNGDICLDNTTTIATFSQVHLPQRLMLAFDCHIRGSTTEISAYLSVNTYQRELIVGVRGSTDLRNWLTDLRFLQDYCPYGNGCRVHGGLWQAFQDIKDDSFYETLRESIHSYPDYNVTVTGHSLCGAVALLLGSGAREEFYGTNVDIYTYGAPRAGNAVLMNYIRNQPGSEYRITHYNDQVPRLPPAVYLGYAHTTPEYWLRDGPQNRLAYTEDQIATCTDFVNMDCVGAAIYPGVIAHNYYFVHMTRCEGHAHSPTAPWTGNPGNALEKTFWNQTGYDKDLLERLEIFSQIDQRYAEIVVEVANQGDS